MTAIVTLSIAADAYSCEEAHASGIAGVHQQQDVVLFDDGRPVCRIAIHWLHNPAEVPVVICSQPRHAGERD
jgi:hypothetical protein